jgi:hypothetical protein
MCTAPESNEEEDRLMGPEPCPVSFSVRLLTRDDLKAVLPGSSTVSDCQHVNVIHTLRFCPSSSSIGIFTRDITPLYPSIKDILIDFLELEQSFNHSRHSLFQIA